MHQPNWTNLASARTESCVRTGPTGNGPSADRVRCRNSLLDAADFALFAFRLSSLVELRRATSEIQL